MRYTNTIKIISTILALVSFLTVTFGSPIDSACREGRLKCGGGSPGGAVFACEKDRWEVLMDCGPFESCTDDPIPTCTWASANAFTSLVRCTVTTLPLIWYDRRFLCLQYLSCFYFLILSTVTDTCIQERFYFQYEIRPRHPRFRRWLRPRQPRTSRSAQYPLRPLPSNPRTSVWR